MQYTYIIYYLHSGHIIWQWDLHDVYNRESDCDLHIPSYYDVFWLTVMQYT